MRHMKKSADKSSTPEDLRARAREANRRLEQAVQALDNDDVEGSLTFAEGVFEETSALFDQIAAHCRDALFKGKLAHRTADKAELDAFMAGRASKIDVDQYLHLLTRFDRTLALADKEINHHYPRRWWALPFVRQHLKAVVIGAIALLLLVAGVTVWRGAEMKRRGLRGAYFADRGFGRLYRERQDREVNFDWDMGPPFRGGRTDDFSVRWTGFLRVPKTGTYQFFTHSDDGVRVKIDEKAVIENWTVHRMAVDQGSMTLSEGLHPITIEYFENKRRAVLKFLWKSETDDKPRVISSAYLTPTHE